MTSRDLQLEFESFTAYWPGFGDPETGSFIFELAASTVEVHAFLPAPIAGTELLFFAGDVTKTVDITSTNTGKLAGVSGTVVTLANVGDAFAVRAAPDGSTWHPFQPTTIII